MVKLLLNGALLKCHGLRTRFSIHHNRYQRQRVAFKWAEECAKTRPELATRVLNQPRWFHHFKDLVTDDNCLYILSDSCDAGGGVSLHVCNIPDARDVVLEVHLSDHSMSKLLNVKFKCFSEKKQRLPTFELV